jgi:C4-dicarboxylate-specific signal transduction histidine kinase
VDFVQPYALLTQRQLAERGIVVCTEVSEDLPLVLGDRVQLQQVLLNLIINGAEAMSAVPSPRRVLTIGGQRLEENGQPVVLVTVSDLGCGFGTTEPEHLFEAFYTTKPHGIGMGLRISHSIIEAHGGRLLAQANEDVGSTFLFTLPVVEPLVGK